MEINSTILAQGKALDGGHMERELIALKVAGMSNPAKVATSIVRNMQEGRLVEAVAIGAAAVNQALKAVAIARGLVAPCGWDLTVSPGFRDLLVEGETKTGLVLSMLRR